MEILSFKIVGKIGHFRKYYANNTAFSFSIPPRTALMGIVAAAMGWPKDSYYEDLASEEIRFGVRVLTPLKKSFHRLNLLSIKSLGDMSKKWSSDFRGEGGRIQTPFEIILPWEISKNDIAFQVFIMPTESGKDIYNTIKTHFLNKEPVYGISMGTANFTAHLKDVQIFEDHQIKTNQSNEYVHIHSALPIGLVDNLKFDKEDYENYNCVEEDMLPGDFIANGNREVRKMNKLLFSITPNPLRVKLNDQFYSLHVEEDVILNIQFMDS